MSVDKLDEKLEKSLKRRGGIYYACMIWYIFVTAGDQMISAKKKKKSLCKSNVRQLLFRCSTLHHLLKRSKWARRWRAPIDPWFHWSPPHPSFFFFLSAAKRGDGSHGSYEKVSLWIRMVKRWAPRWGAAWTITAGAAADCAALQPWCAEGLSLQTCSRKRYSA